MRKKVVLLCVIFILTSVFLAVLGYKAFFGDSIKLTPKEGAIFIKYECLAVETDSDFLEYTQVDTNGVLSIGATYKIIIPGKKMPSVSRQLSGDELTKLYKLIYDKNLLHMKNDISTVSADGSIEYLTFYLEDGSEYRVGGLNPNNRKFDLVTNYISSLSTPDMDEELIEEMKAYDDEVNTKLQFDRFYSDLKAYGFDVTEDLLLSVDNIYGLMIDIENVCFEANFFNSYASFDYAKMYFSGEGYFINREGEEWLIHIGNKLIGKLDFISPAEIYADEINTYHLKLTDMELCTYNLRDLFYWAEKIRNGENLSIDMDYDEVNDIYTLEYDEYSFDGDGNGTYEILYYSEVIGYFTVIP